MSKAYTKTIITINLDRGELIFGCTEVGEDVATESFLKDLFKPTTYLKLNKSYDIFNTISQAVIKASNGKKAYLPIKKVDEIYLVNRLLLQTPFVILRLRIKKSKVFYKPKHLEGILRDFELKHVMSNDENSMFKSLLNPRPHIRKHIYGTRLDHPILGVGDKEIPIKALTPVDMERIMKEAGSIRKVSCGDKPTTEETTKQEDTLSPFYSFISPARRVMFQNAMNEIDSMLSMALDASKTKLSDVERMADIVYPCITKAVKEFRKNKQENDYYVVFCTGADTVESFSVNDNELERKLSVLKETQQHKFLDLSILSRIPVVKEECKELTTELLNFVLDKLPSDIVNKVVRIVFNISFLDKYRDEYIKTNNKQLFFGIDHVFRKPGFDTESYINFKQCDLSNFMLETNSGILKLKVKGEI